MVLVSGVTQLIVTRRLIEEGSFPKMSQKEPAKRLKGGGSAGKEESFGFARCVTVYSREQEKKKKKILSQIKECELKGTF